MDKMTDAPALEAASTPMLFCSGFGQTETRARVLSDGRPNPHSTAGSDYLGISIKEVGAMARNPPSVPKAEARWLLGSVYRASDARTAKVQRERGQFHLLPLDLDSGNLSLEQVQEAIVAVCGDASRAAYATRSSTEANKKWRVLLLLAAPLAGADYGDTLVSLNALLEEASGGVLIPDPSLCRPNQPVFLPNRGEHYRFEIVPGAGLLDLTGHPITQRRDEDRAAWAQAEAAVKAARAEKASNAPPPRPGDNTSVIEGFNAANPIAQTLLRHGYVQDGDSPNFRSPLQNGKTFATRDFGDFWISHSTSDAGAKIGAQAKDGFRFGDSFDVEVHFAFTGNSHAAISAIAKELGLDHKSRRARERDEDAARARTTRWTDFNDAPRQDGGVDKDTAHTDAPPEEPATSTGGGGKWTDFNDATTQDIPDFDAPPGEDAKPGSAQAEDSAENAGDGGKGASGGGPGDGPESEKGGAAEGGRKSRFLKASDLSDKPVPKREWLVADLIPMDTVTLFSGDGGTGKSLLMLQLAAAVAGKDGRWLGLPVTHGGVLVLSAEDDEDELHRRFAGIALAESVLLMDLERLVYRSLAGEDALLALMNGMGGALAPSDLYRELDAYMEVSRFKLLVLDTSADLFPANENDRAQVRQFVGLLRGLAIRHNCAVILLSHPSVSGMTSGSGSSGSTAWSNSVRARLYLERVKDSDGTEPDPMVRRLSSKKSNYGAVGLEITMTWRDGVFWADTAPTGLDRLAASAKAERVFLKLLRQFTEQGRTVNSNAGPAYAPKVFAQNPGAEGCTDKALRGAMNALFATGKIVVVKEGPPSRPTSHIALTPASDA